MAFALLLWCGVLELNGGGEGGYYYCYILFVFVYGGEGEELGSWRSWEGCLFGVLKGGGEGCGGIGNA